MNIILTSDGINLMLRSLSGDEIVFTSVCLGNGQQQEIDTISGLGNPLLDVEFASQPTIENSYAKLSVSFSNSKISAGFRVTELGVYAQNPDDLTKTILYGYGYEPEESADYVAASTSRITETALDIMVFIGATENVSAAISSSLIYATQTEFESHTGNKNNPHSVTAEQIGLGSVENKATNDQTPTYDEALNLMDLSSGEKMSIAFGKIKKAVSQLISHLQNKSNPHGVTALQSGAAAATHYHSTTDLTSGTLSATRGGTGASSHASGGVLIGNASNPISTLRGVGAL